MTDTYERLREDVFALEIYDTHEHLPAFESQRDPHSDVLSEYLGQYFSCDLVSAGLPMAHFRRAEDPSGPLAERWKLVEPYWEAARNTGYGRALDVTARDLYGFDRIDADTIGPLNEAFRAARAGGETYRRVLKETSRIALSLNDKTGVEDCDTDFFRLTVRLDDFITPESAADVEALERRADGRHIHTLEDLQAAAEHVLDRALGTGKVLCLKHGLAYIRPLRYEKVPAARAAEAFNALRMRRPGDGTSLAARPLQDFMMHHVCRLAEARGLVMQVHTGLQEGTGNYVTHTDPTLLTNLFLEYGGVRFDVFHIGYPYQQVLSALAKNFANVFIDFCWAQIISPTASVRALAEYLDAVPANKISGFGGDYGFVDAVYGHQYIARENVARALATKVDEGTFDLDRARQLARMILRDNPAALWGLKQ